MTNYKDLRTVKQLATAEGSPFSEAGLRWLIFNAEDNGLAPAIVRVGRRVLIDTERFNAWLEGQRSAAGAGAA